jgi:hypothetical protein
MTQLESGVGIAVPGAAGRHGHVRHAQSGALGDENLGWEEGVGGSGGEGSHAARGDRLSIR